MVGHTTGLPKQIGGFSFYPGCLDKKIAWTLPLYNSELSAFHRDLGSWNLTFYPRNWLKKPDILTKTACKREIILL